MTDQKQPLTSDQLKEIIFQAFKDVAKGGGLGVRYCTALDGHGDASGQDIEEHWWEYPDDLKDSRFTNALFFNNSDGIRFHLPALMTAAQVSDDEDSKKITALAVSYEIFESSLSDTLTKSQKSESVRVEN